MKRFLTTVTVLIFLGLFMVACGGAAPAPPAEAPKEEEPQAAAPAEESEPAAEEPAAEEPAAESAGESVTEVVIGAIHPLTGGLARDGAFLQNGIDMAVEEINAAGGIQSLGGAKLVVEHADSQGKPEVGQSEAERLIGEGVSALVGSYQSSVTLNATQVAEREKVPFLIDVAVSNEITSRGFKYTFRIQPNQTGMARGAAEGLKALREATGQELKTAVVLHEDSIFGTGITDIFTGMAPDYDIEVIGDVAYSLQGLTDLTTEIAKVQALQPDVLLVAGYLNDGILFARTAKELNLDVKAIFGLAHGAFSTPQFIEEVGADTSNYIMDANYHYDASNPKAQEVRANYKAKYNEEMPTHAVMAYEAIYVLADAIERAGSTDPQAIRDALAETNFADHILPYAGPIQFDETGENVNARAIVMQIQNGEILQVLPSDVAEVDPVYPGTPWNPPDMSAEAAAAPAGGGETAEQVVIGAIHPLTGGLARDGAFLQNGIDMAVEEINAAGGIQSLGGAKLVVEHADSQGKPEVGQSEAERLIGEGVSALVGSYQSSVTLNATQVAEREKVPFLIDVAVSNEITSRGFKYTFRIQPNQTGMARGAAEGLKVLRETTGEDVNTVVILHEDSIFGTGITDIFKEMAPDYDIEVVGDVAYSLQGLTDLTTEIAKVQALQPDVLMVSGYLNDGILATRTAEELNLDVKAIFGLSDGAFSTPQFIEEVGADTSNYIMDANYHYDASNPKAQEVRANYKAKYNEEMPTHAVMAYEAIYVLADAIERAGSTDPQAIRDALAETNFADHILPYAGPIQFDETGENVNARAIVMQIQNSEILQVLPSDVAEVDPVYPVPGWTER